MPQPHQINYVELPAENFTATKRFFQEAFGWEFQDFGPDYTAFSHAQSGLDGGFFRSTKRSLTERGCALVVLYSDDLEASLAKVEKHGGKVLGPIFSFPGGRRFPFSEPSGNELAIWSDRDVNGEMLV